MEVKKFEFILEAVSPIAHASETIGNTSIAMRRKVRMPGGGWAHVPAITGDTMRHGLREAVAYAFLDAAGILNEGKLGEAALRFLFAGGMVTGRGDASTIKLDDYQVMLELCPQLALLGGCANNRVIPGRMMVDDAILVCKEAKALIPEWIVAEAGDLDTCRAHVEVAQRVRMDPTLDPGKRKLLSTGSQAEIAKRLTASEVAHDADDAIERDSTKSSMMPRTHECVVAGSLFSWAITATTWTDLDSDALHTMIATFLANARVGGKRGTGHGAIRALKARGVIVNRPSRNTETLDTNALAPKVGELFRAHCAARKDRIAEFLGSVNS